MDWKENIKYFDETPKARKVKILSQGETKVGKTYFISTCPSPFIIDTDGSLEGLPDTHKHLPVLRLSVTQVFNREIDVFDTILSIFDAIKNKKPPFDKIVVETLVIDSLSMLAELLMIELMLNQRVGITEKRTSGYRNPMENKPSFDEYNALKNRLLAIHTSIDDLGCHVYETCGVKLDKDEERGTIIVMPDIEGSFRQKIGHRFTIVMEMSRDRSGKFIARLMGDDKVKLGARNYKGPTVVENPTFEKLTGIKP